MFIPLTLTLSQPGEGTYSRRVVQGWRERVERGRAARRRISTFDYQLSTIDFQQREPS